MKSLLTPEYTAKIEDAGGRELLAHNTYNQFGNYMSGIGYFGAAAFFKKEAQDELTHFQLWSDYVNDRGGILNVVAVPAITDKPMGLKSAFQSYYNLENSLGEFYNDLYSECEDATMLQILLTFVEIQRKSIGEAGDLLATLDRCGDDAAALLLFDKQLNG